MAHVISLVLVALLAASAPPADARLSSRLLREHAELFFPELPHWVAKIVVAKAESKPVLSKAQQVGGSGTSGEIVSDSVNPSNPESVTPAETGVETPAEAGTETTTPVDTPTDGSSSEAPPLMQQTGAAYQDSQASAPSSVSPPSPNPGGCPPTGSECDFYFTGFQNQIPTFTLLGGGDKAISPSIEASVKGSVVNVIALNSQTAEYVCNAAEIPDNNQFYVVQDVVQVRTIQSQDLGKFNGVYVKIPISNAEIEVYNQVFNLNPGDGSSSFPEERRCVIFKTA